MGTLPLDDPARELLRIALEEDLGEEGDITSAFFVPLDLRKKARIFGKEEGITLSGVSLAAEVFAMVDPELVVSCEAQEGETIAREQSVLTVEGKVQSILTAERTALNFLQRLSGVASLTHKYVLAAGSRVQVLDTRKTTPG
ncbi:MAG: nicotinate-nucleotide diphosphorylase (carboxylating), partial [Verrucomicrobiota bacterium]